MRLVDVAPTVNVERQILGVEVAVRSTCLTKFFGSATVHADPAEVL